MPHRTSLSKFSHLALKTDDAILLLNVVSTRSTGVMEYWVVDQENQLVLQYRYTRTDEVMFNASDILRSDLLPGFEITIENLFKY